MNFEVKYRAPNGAIRVEHIEAASRSVCMAECRRRGIAPIGVSETRNQPHFTSTSTRSIYLVPVVLLVAAMTGVWWWSASHDTEAKEFPQSQSIQKVPEKKATPKHIVEFQPKTRPVKTAKIPAPEIVKADVFLEPLKSMPTNLPAIKLEFENSADELIAGVMTARPGERFLHIPDDDEFDRDFNESMKNLLKVGKDDSPELLAKKQAVITAKSAILEYMKDGERPSAVVREAIEHMNMIADYREKLENELAEFSQHATRKEVTEYMGEANKLLAEYGVDPLTFDLDELPPEDDPVSESDDASAVKSENETRNGEKQ